MSRKAGVGPGKEDLRRRRNHIASSQGAGVPSALSRAFVSHRGFVQIRMFSTSLVARVSTLVPRNLTRDPQT